MIRFLFLILIFVIGVAAAVFWQGQMHHLRQALPNPLPPWTEQIEDTARLSHGEMQIPADSFRPALILRWTAISPSVGGLRWALSLKGQGIDLSADLLLPFWPDHAVLRNGAGTIQLRDLVTGLDINGIVQINRLSGRLGDMLNTPRPSGVMTATLHRIDVQGAALGDGPLAVELDALGTITGTLSLRGGLTAIDALLSGTYGAAFGQVDLTIEDTTKLPTFARGPLESLGTSDGRSLRLRLPVPLR